MSKRLADVAVAVSVVGLAIGVTIGIVVERGAPDPLEHCMAIGRMIDIHRLDEGGKVSTQLHLNSGYYNVDAVEGTPHKGALIGWCSKGGEAPRARALTFELSPPNKVGQGRGTAVHD